MTTIAWDGKTLAADKLASTGNGRGKTTKIFRIRDCLFGATGTQSLCIEMAEWFRAGAVPADLPALQKDPNKNAGVLVVLPDGSLQKYESGPYPLPVDDEKFAIGSGGDFARAAMYFGLTAVEAIAVAEHFDVNTGNGVDSLVLER